MVISQYAELVMNKPYNRSSLILITSLFMLSSACSPAIGLPPPKGTDTLTVASFPANASASITETPTRYVEAVCATLPSQNLAFTPDINVQWTLNTPANTQFPRIPIPPDYDSTSREKREAVLKKLLTFWLEFQKTEADSSRYAIRDYKIGEIRQTQPRGNPTPEIAAFIELWIIPSKTPHGYASYPGDIPASFCSWWHIYQMSFAVYREDGYFLLGLYSGGG